jgi:ammonia channel protein AmtB
VMLAAGCFLYRSWEAFLIGTIGAIITCISMPLIDKMRIDDPVGASAVHGNNTVVPTDALNCQ